MITLDKFRHNIVDIKEYVREKRCGDNIIYHYTIYPHDDNLWNNFYLREARGITFSAIDGSIVSRPYHKFFNLGEVPETYYDNLFTKDEINIITFEKLDGSLIIIEYDRNGNLVCRTKKSYDNIQAQLANELLKEEPKKSIEFIKWLLDNNYTPMYELISSNPRLRIVVEYEYDSLVFLAARHKITGKYFFGEKRGNLFKYKSEFLYYLNKLEETENIEGIVGVVNGVFFKYKTKWYLQRHRAKELLKAPKSFVELFIDGKLDDVFSLITNPNDLVYAKKLENICFKHYNQLMNDISSIIEKDGKMNRKEFALKYKDRDYFGLLIRKYCGQDFDVKKYFMKYKYPIIKKEFESIIVN